MKTALSLFSNIGVSEAYLEDVGVRVIAVNELDAERCDVYEKIYPGVEVIRGDITSESVKNEIISVGKVDFLIATPPCQGFSTLNSKKKDDPRNYLLTHALEVVNNIRPSYVLIENVPRMLSQVIDGKPVLDFIVENVPGYRYSHHILDAADYGTPQSRRRAFVLLSRKELSHWKLPDKEERISLKTAIGHLPSIKPSSVEEVRVFGHKWHYSQKHSANHIDWMSHTPTGKSAFSNYGFNDHYPHVVRNGVKEKIKGYANTYKRMRWDKPAPTLIAGSTMISSSNTVHPGKKRSNGTYSDPRTLSVLEAMLVMGLPEDWNLPDIPYRKAVHFIGEGLCPKLLKALIEPLN